MKNEKLSDFVQHLAWMIIGQECDCGHNPFNGLARLANRYVNDDSQWDTETCEPTGKLACCACFVSDKVRYVAEKLMPDFEASPSNYVEHGFDTENMDNADAEYAEWNRVHFGDE